VDDKPGALADLTRIIKTQRTSQRGDGQPTAGKRVIAQAKNFL
jgi:hypothetical protein